MLFLPLEEDSWLFRLCLYYGLLVLLLEMLVPLVFHRRVHIEIPRLALRGPAAPLSTREFVQRRRALQQQLAALQRALAETPRHSPQRSHVINSANAAKGRPDASPSPSHSPSSSPLASPTSSVKVSRLKSSRKTSESRRRIEARSDAREELRDRDEARQRREHKEVDGEQMQVSSQRTGATNNSSATRTAPTSGFSFDEVAWSEEKEEEDQESRHEAVAWGQAVNIRAARRRESPTFSGRRPVRLVPDDVGAMGYTGPSEAASRLEALIRARRRRASNTPLSVPPPTQPPVATATSSPSPPCQQMPTVPAVAVDESLEGIGSSAPKPAPEAASSPLVEQVEGETVEDDEETKESELQEPLTDFQAFCASFATGGSSAAQLVIAKRKHDEAFGREDEQAHGGAAVAQQSFEKRKQPRVQEQEIEQVEDDNVAAVHQSNEKRKHHEAFGSEGEGEDAIDDGVVEQVLEKRTHDEAFGEEERPQEKTPRIARRISFTDEVEALSAHPPKEVPGGHSAAKRKHQQAFGMIDEEDEDAEWRESLAFRPHRSG